MRCAGSAMRSRRPSLIDAVYVEPVQAPGFVDIEAEPAAQVKIGRTRRALANGVPNCATQRAPRDAGARMPSARQRPGPLRRAHDRHSRRCRHRHAKTPLRPASGTASARAPAPALRPDETIARTRGCRDGTAPTYRGARRAGRALRPKPDMHSRSTAERGRATEAALGLQRLRNRSLMRERAYRVQSVPGAAPAPDRVPNRQRLRPLGDLGLLAQPRPQQPRVQVAPSNSRMPWNDKRHAPHSVDVPLAGIVPGHEHRQRRERPSTRRRHAKSPAFAGLFLALATDASGRAYAHRSCSTMVWSRSGPVETIASGQPASSSSARR